MWTMMRSLSILAGFTQEVIAYSVRHIGCTREYTSIMEGNQVIMTLRCHLTGLVTKIVNCHNASM